MAQGDKVTLEKSSRTQYLRMAGQSSCGYGSSEKWIYNRSGEEKENAYRKAA